MDKDFAAVLAPWLDDPKLIAQGFEPHFYESQEGIFLQRQATLSEFPNFSKDFFRDYDLAESDLREAEITLEYVVNKGLFQWSVLFNKGSFHEQHEFEVYEVGTQEYEQIINLLGIDDPCIEGKISPVNVTDMQNAIHALLEYIDAIPEDIQLPAMPGVDRDWIESLLSKRN